MAPGQKKSGKTTLPSDNLIEDATASQPTNAPADNQIPGRAVTQEDLEAAMAEINQRVENSNKALMDINKAMMEKFEAILNARANPRVGIRLGEGEPSSSPDILRANTGAIPEENLGLNAGAPSQIGRVDSQPPNQDCLPRQTSERENSINPVRPSQDEDYISGMVEQLVKKSLAKEDAESDWGYASSKTPFTKKILGAEQPRKFIPPSVPAYNGTSDPNLFLFKYDCHMNGVGATDELKCRYFPLYLEGVALSWFYKLTPSSIDEFYDLAKKFKEQFRLQAKKAKDIMSLSGLDQRPGEPLKAFLTRFNAAVAEVDNPEPKMILMALVRAIDEKSEFGKWIKMKKSSLTFEKFHKKAEEFISLEEDLSTTQGDNKETHTQKRPNENHGNWKKDGKRVRFLKAEDRTPLTETPEHIYFATRNTHDYPRPPPIHVGEKAAKSGKFCKFHNQPGHDTNECRYLRNLIEELIKQDKLPQYVQKSQAGGSSLPGQGQSASASQLNLAPSATAQPAGRMIIN